jgi:hypothetical protein
MVLNFTLKASEKKAITHFTNSQCSGAHDNSQLVQKLNTLSEN